MAWAKLVTKCGCIKYLDIPENLDDWDVPLLERVRVPKVNEDLSNYYPILKRRFRFDGIWEGQRTRVFYEAD
jgi:hypothetical protein